MSSTARFVRASREKLKARPMLPFGAPFELGLIGTVDDDQFIRRGTVQSILNTTAGASVTSQQPSNWQTTSGRDVKLNFLAEGEASTLFPSAPTASAKIEISFASDESFLVSVNRLIVSTLADPAALLAAMLDAYKRGVWREEYVLIYETITPAEALILLSTNSGTNLLLAAKGTAAPPTGVADIAGKFEIKYQTQDVLRLDSGGQPLFYNGYRVEKPFWGHPVIRPFSAVDPTGGVFEQV